MKLLKLDLSAQKKTCKPATFRRVLQASSRALSLHHSPSHQFALCQWQTESRLSTAYLIYRWLLFICLVVITVTSFVYQRLPKDYKGPVVEVNYFKYFIYFTNWGFMLLTLQAGFALAVVHRYKSERHFATPYTEEGDTVTRRPRTPLLCRLYWLTQSISIDLAFVITLVYWTLVHDPRIHEINALNLLVHGGNSLTVLCEILVTSHPIRAAHALYGASAGVTYGVFSAVYWAAGGTDKLGNTYIYPALDWDKPGTAFGFVTLCACVMCCTHALATALAAVRTRLAARVHSRHRPDTLAPTPLQ